MATRREPDRNTQNGEVDTEWGQGRRDPRFPNIVWHDPGEDQTTIVFLHPSAAARR